MMTPNAMYAPTEHHCALIAENADLVKRIAYRLASRLPASVQIEDLIQAGMLGLLEAHERYRPGEGASFSTFAGIRIRGAMLDEIRRGDWTPRSVHRAWRAATEARQTVEERCGRQAAEAEVAAELGQSLDDYRHVVADAAAAQLASLDDAGPDTRTQEIPGREAAPQEQCERQRLFAAVVAASETLPEREHLLLTWYYDQGFNLREIAEKLGVSESRACQLHGRAISRVREQLHGWAA